MTFSILTYDQKTGVFAAAAATGSLCVGGWVLRGDIESGLCASQGTSPSTFWRDGAMRLLHGGMPASEVVASLTSPDTGRAHRQLCVLDKTGATAGFTGSESVGFADVIAGPDLIAGGNMIRSLAVLEALAETYIATAGTPAARLLAALHAADAAGGDTRGLQSAALLVLRPDAPPLDLRIDYSDTPLEDLARLSARAEQPPYADWLDEVPVLTDPARAVTTVEDRTAKVR